METSTTKAQRIGIWVIAIVLTVGTIGSFFALAFANSNQAASDADLQAQYEEYVQQQEEAAREHAATSEALSGYQADAFDESGIDSLVVQTLVEGDGKTVETTDTVNVSYFGWMSDGTIFDSTKQKDADDAPTSFSLSGVIQGWTDGIAGKKVGSVLELTIPADQAYGASGSGIIPANAPLKFIVEIHGIETTTEE